MKHITIRQGLCDLETYLVLKRAMGWPALYVADAAAALPTPGADSFYKETTKGYEPFYAPYGLIARPIDRFGASMLFI